MCLITSQTALSKRFSNMVDIQIIVPSYHNTIIDSTINTIVVVTNALFRNYFINNPFLPMIFPFQKIKSIIRNEMVGATVILKNIISSVPVELSI